MLDKFFKGGKKREAEATPTVVSPTIPSPSIPVQTAKNATEVIVTGHCAVCGRAFRYSIGGGKCNHDKCTWLTS